MSTLYKCRAYGIATRIKGLWAVGLPITDKKVRAPMYECTTTNKCEHKRVFGKIYYCSEKLLSEPINKGGKSAAKV